MRLTKKLMWKVVIELWEWMTETGSFSKYKWPGWKEYGKMDAFCPLCEYYNMQHHGSCTSCPIDFCIDDYAYGKWDEAKTKLTRKKYAGLFLAQLKEVRDGIIK